MRLPVVDQAGLGIPSIMDRALASQFGVPYVHLAAFAIDVDRLYHLLEDDPDLPMGWELFLTVAYLKGLTAPEHEEMVHAACEAIMSAPGPALGSQLPFAVHALVRGGAFPDLEPLFARWSRKAEHVDRVRQCEATAGALSKIAARCLATPVDPPLAPPTREALAQMTSR